MAVNRDHWPQACKGSPEKLNPRRKMVIGTVHHQEEAMKMVISLQMVTGTGMGTKMDTKGKMVMQMGVQVN